MPCSFLGNHIADKVTLHKHGASGFRDITWSFPLSPYSPLVPLQSRLTKEESVVTELQKENAQFTLKYAHPRASFSELGSREIKKQKQTKQNKKPKVNFILDQPKKAVFQFSQQTGPSIIQHVTHQCKGVGSMRGLGRDAGVQQGGGVGQ